MVKIDAPIKLNLFLHIIGRYDNGYHALNSLVAFLDSGDELEISVAEKFSCNIQGEFALQLQNELKKNSDDILLKTKKLFEFLFKYEIKYHILLSKNIPVAAGLGGGSADSAAFLRFLCSILNTPHTQILPYAAQIGADVPMCLESESCFVEGIGEKITPVKLPDFYVILVNPRIDVSTPEIFKKYRSDGITFSQKIELPSNLADNYENFISFLGNQKNDLMPAASSLNPEIQQVLSVINDANEKADICPKMTYVSMAGSGATCFGIYPDEKSANKIYKILVEKYPNWWIKKCRKNNMNNIIFQ